MVGIDKLRELPTWDGFHSGKLDVTTDGCIKRYSIDKKDVSGEGDVLFGVKDGWWDVHIVNDNWIGFGASSLAFQICNDGAVYGVVYVHVIGGYRAVNNHVVLDGTCYGPTVTQSGHGIRSCPDTGYKLFVTENVARRLVVKEE